MELKLKNGDYVSDGAGGFCRVEGREALLQRVVFRLTARRGSCLFLETLGSRLWQLGQLPPASRQTAAEQFVAEALAPEAGLQVEDVALTDLGEGLLSVTVDMTYEGEALSVTLDIQ